MNADFGHSEQVKAPAPPVRYVQARECIAGEAWLREEGEPVFRCGCRSCRPEGWCAARLESGEPCGQLRAYLPPASEHPYCVAHYRQLVIGESLKNLCVQLSEIVADYRRRKGGTR